MPAGHGTTRATPRIAACFARLAERGELGLIVYLTAGDPSPEASERLVLAAAEAGADAIELGVPFSDPVADGPVIQRASERALRAGTTLAGVLELAARLRQQLSIPLIVFSYLNPVFQMGFGEFARRAAAAGVDGVLVTDLPPEEADGYLESLAAHGLDPIFLAAPTTTEGRLEAIAARSRGFLYLVSRTGVTGAQRRLPEDLQDLIRRVRRVSRLPVAVGFGLSEPEHLSALRGAVEAAVVGSALVALVEQAGSATEAASALADRVRALKRACRAS